jgi:hypothetical protein
MEQKNIEQLEKENIELKAKLITSLTIIEFKNSIIKEYEFLFNKDIFKFVKILQDHADWSDKTFGEGKRTIGLVKHIQKELNEILENPTDLVEWCDVVILAFDGFRRAGGSPSQFLSEISNKILKNFSRKYKMVPEDQPSEHDRTLD